MTTGTDSETSKAAPSYKIHFGDLLNWLIGGIERVSAETETVANEMECEDLAVVSLEFANGTRGVIEATTAVRGGEDRVELNGTEGSYNSGTFVLEGEEVKPDLIELPTGTGLEGQVRDFVEAIREDRDPIMGGRDAREAVEVVLVAYANCRTTPDRRNGRGANDQRDRDMIRTTRASRRRRRRFRRRRPAHRDWRRAR